MALVSLKSVERGAQLCLAGVHSIDLTKKTRKPPNKKKCDSVT